jgi:hypothetical protein
MEVKNRIYTMNSVENNEGQEDSKSEHGAESGIAMFTDSNVTDRKNRDRMGDAQITKPNNWQY